MKRSKLENIESAFENLFLIAAPVLGTVVFAAFTAFVCIAVYKFATMIF